MDRRTALFTLGSALATALAPIAHAQTLAGRQFRFIVGYPAGGVADFSGRTVVEGLRHEMDITTIVENRTGAGGNIALDFIARQEPDAGVFGVFSNSLFTTNPFVPQLASKSVDPLTEMVPIAAMADMILVLAASAHLNVKTLDGFLTEARSRSPAQRLRIGLAGVGTAHHLAALLLQREANLDVTLVPYKGGAPMIADAAGGHLDAVFTTVPVGGPMVATGKLNWIAIVQPTEVKSLAGIPSMVNVLKGATIPSWLGIFAPANTPKDVVATMHQAVTTVVNSPEISAKLRQNGLEPLRLSYPDTVKLVSEEAKFMKDFLAKIGLDFAT